MANPHSVKRRFLLHFADEKYSGASMPIEGFWLSLADSVAGLLLWLLGKLWRSAPLSFLYLAGVIFGVVLTVLDFSWFYLVATIYITVRFVLKLNPPTNSTEK